MPTNPVMSAYQTLPSRSTATLNGRALSRGSAEDLDAAVAQPPEARAAHHAEPDIVIRGEGNAAETGIFPTRLDIRELSVLESPDAIGAELQEPHRAVGTDPDVSRDCAGTRKVECPAGPVGRELEQLVAVLQRHPYGAVGRHCDPVGAAARGLDLMAGKNAVLQPGHAIASLVGKPGGAVGRDRQPSEASDRSIEHKSCDLADAADVRNGARGEVRVPGAAVSRDREPERLDVAARRGQPFDVAVAHTADRVGMVDSEPDTAISARRNRDRRILRLAHAVLDEFFLRNSPHQQKRAPAEDRDAEHRGYCSDS